MKCVVSLLLIISLALPAFSQQEPFTEFVRDDATRVARIEVDATRGANFSIPPTLFGTFTENIWDAVYGGVWAQVLHNPSFEPDYLSAQNMTDAARYSRLVTDPSFGSGYVRVEPLREPTTADDRDRFLRSSSLGLPLPWEALRPAGVRYEPRDGDAANSYRSLLIMGLPDREVGIKQGIYLPVHRTRKYKGSLWVKIDTLGPLPQDGPSDGRYPMVKLSLRRRDKPDEALAGHLIRYETCDTPIGNCSPQHRTIGDPSGWNRHEFEMELPPSEVAALEKVDFCISVYDERRVMIDDVRLFPADHIEGFDPEVIAAARALRTPLLRFGGNFVSGYHWQDGVGLPDKRRTMLNQAWGLPEYNHFGTDEFIRLCRLIGAEPQISVNAGSGTAEEAAAWVEYCNGDASTKYGKMRAANGHREPYNVRYWEIGNELWGDFQIGWQTAESNARRYKEFIAAMRRVDKNLRFIATGADIDFYREWNGKLIENAGADLDLISTHLVIGMQPAEQRAPDADDAFTHKADFAVPVGVGRKLDEMRRQLESDARTKGRTKLAFTEWQFWSPRPADPRFTNLGGAINAAAFFHMLMRRADFVPVSNISNLVQFAGIHRQRGRTFFTPSYHAMRLYSDMTGARLLHLRLRASGYDVSRGNRRLPDIPNVPHLDALALLAPDKRTLRIYLVNRSLETTIRAEVVIRGFEFGAQATLRKLDAPNISSANTPEQPSSVTVKTLPLENAPDDLRRFSIPAHSVNVIELKRL